MRRREFMTLAASVAALGWPTDGTTQQVDRARRIGVLLGGSDAKLRLLQQLQTVGLVEGRNIHIEFREHGGDPDQLRAYAAELISLSPEVIVAETPIEVKALRRETSTIPIVFTAGVDPVSQGIIESFAHPGGNVTGCASFEFSMGGKWLQILNEIDQQVKHVSIVFNPDTAPYMGAILRSVEAAAAALRMQISAVPVHNFSEIEGLVISSADEPGRAIIFPPDIFTTAKIRDIIALVAKHNIPAVYSIPVFATYGGLIAYGPDLIENFRRAAILVDRILKGARPADLPVEQPTKFEFVINLKTAKALNLEIPPAMLARADKVIE